MLQERLHGLHGELRHQHQTPTSPERERHRCVRGEVSVCREADDGRDVRRGDGLSDTGVLRIVRRLGPRPVHKVLVREREGLGFSRRARGEEDGRDGVGTWNDHRAGRSDLRHAGARHCDGGYPEVVLKGISGRHADPCRITHAQQLRCGVAGHETVDGSDGQTATPGSQRRHHPLRLIEHVHAERPTRLSPVGIELGSQIRSDARHVPIGQ